MNNTGIKGLFRRILMPAVGLTEHQQQLIRANFEDLLPVQETAAALFYGRLSMLDPELGVLCRNSNERAKSDGRDGYGGRQFPLLERAVSVAAGTRTAAGRLWRRRSRLRDGRGGACLDAGTRTRRRLHGRNARSLDCLLSYLVRRDEVRRERKEGAVVAPVLSGRFARVLRPQVGAERASQRQMTVRPSKDHALGRCEAGHRRSPGLELSSCTLSLSTHVAAEPPRRFR